MIWLETKPIHPPHPRTSAKHYYTQIPGPCLKSAEKKYNEYFDIFENSKEDVFESFGEYNGKNIIVKAKRMASKKIQQKETTLKKKLIALRKEKAERSDFFENSEGSRK